MEHSESNKDSSLNQTDTTAPGSTPLELKTLCKENSALLQEEKINIVESNEDDPDASDGAHDPNFTNKAESWIISDLSFLKDPWFIWKHKNFVLFPLDLYLDTRQAENHFSNGHYSWGSLTLLFICLPNIIKTMDVAWTNWSEKKKRYGALKYLFFLPWITTFCIWNFARRSGKYFNEKSKEKDTEGKKITRQKVWDAMENDKDLCSIQDEVTNLTQFEVYAESTPQAILQAYTLWKRPIQCFHANPTNFLTYGTILTSIISITSSAVDVYFLKHENSTKNKGIAIGDKKLESYGKAFMVCLVLIIAPKIAIFSWIFAAYRWIAFLLFIILMVTIYVVTYVQQDCQPTVKSRLTYAYLCVFGINENIVASAITLSLSSALALVFLLTSIPISGNEITLMAQNSSSESFYLTMDEFPVSTICYTHKDMETYTTRFKTKNEMHRFDDSCILNTKDIVQPCSKNVVDNIIIIISVMIGWTLLGVAIVILTNHFGSRLLLLPVQDSTLQKIAGRFFSIMYLLILLGILGAVGYFLYYLIYVLAYNQNFKEIYQGGLSRNNTKTFLENQGNDACLLASKAINNVTVDHENTITNQKITDANYFEKTLTFCSLGCDGICEFKNESYRCKLDYYTKDWYADSFKYEAQIAGIIATVVLMLCFLFALCFGMIKRKPESHELEDETKNGESSHENHCCINIMPPIVSYSICGTVILALLIVGLYCIARDTENSSQRKQFMEDGNYTLFNCTSESSLSDVYGESHNASWQIFGIGIGISLIVLLTIPFILIIIIIFLRFFVLKDVSFCGTICFGYYYSMLIFGCIFLIGFLAVSLFSLYIVFTYQL